MQLLYVFTLRNITGEASANWMKSREQKMSVSLLQLISFRHLIHFRLSFSFFPAKQVVSKKNIRFISTAYIRQTFSFSSKMKWAIIGQPHEKWYLEFRIEKYERAQVVNNYKARFSNILDWVSLPPFLAQFCLSLERRVSLNLQSSKRAGVGEEYCARILEQYLGAKNWVEIGMLYRTHGTYVGWENRFLGIDSWTP